MKRTFILKCITLSALLLGGQVLFASLLGFKDVPSTVQQVENDLDAGADILYFGDSTLYRGDPNEADHSTLPQILQSLVPDHQVGGAYHDAYHLELMDYFVRHALQHENPPEIIIIPINMRSLSLERTLRPEYQFVKEKLFLEHTDIWFRAFYRPLAVFKAFDLEPVTQAQYDATMNYVNGAPIGTFSEINRLPDAQRLPLHVRATYGYPLDQQSPAFRALKNIVSRCARAEVKLIVYATPVDIERGEALIGKEFSTFIHKKTELLEVPLNEGSLPFYNFTMALAPDRFVADTHGYPDAYIDHTGKQWIAQQLAQAIQ